MKLYYSPGACSLSPHIVASEAGIALTLEKVDLKTHTIADGGDYYRINPKGYVPALVLDDDSLLTEGPAIVQYLADLKPEAGLIPASGFTPLPNALIHSQAALGLSANDFVVALNLVSHWWYRKRVSFPGTTLISKRTGLGIRTIQRSLNRLEKRGLIKAVRRGSGGIGYDFEGLIAATERMASMHEWRSGKVEQRVLTVTIDDGSEFVSFDEI